MASRQWQGRRNAQEEEEEEESSSMSATNSREPGSSVTSSEYKKGSGGPPPAYDGSREVGVFEEYRLRAKLWLATTNLDGRSKGPRLMQALTGRAFESVKHMVDDEAWMSSSSNGDQLLDLLNKPEYYGREELESLYLAMNKLFYSELRKAEDDLPSFRSRFEEAVRRIQKHRVQLPQEALGFLFLKQAKVNGESLERLITLTNGDLKLNAVVDGMRRLKMKLFDDGDETSVKKKPLWLQDIAEEQPEYTGAGDDHIAEDEELNMLEDALNELEGEELPGQEISEDGAKEVLMTLIKQRINKPVQMSYKQVQQSKRDVRNSRGFRPVNPQSGSASGGYTMRRDLQQLKAVTKCKSCGQTGHWHRECPNKVRNSSASSATNASGSQVNSGTQHGWWAMVNEEPSVPPETGSPDINHE